MKLTIVIPTLNHGENTQRCLESIGESAAEVIVVDDGSPRPVRCEGRAKVIRHSMTRGRAAALNTGLKAASCDMVLILDDDIHVMPGMIERMVQDYMQWNNPHGVLVGRIGWDLSLALTLTMRWLEEYGPLRDVSTANTGTLSELMTGTYLVWRPFVLDHGGFDEAFADSPLADVDLGLRLKPGGLEIRLSPRPVACRHRVVRVPDMMRSERDNGLSAVYLHSKFPSYLPRIADTALLLATEQHADSAADAAAQLARLETDESALDDRAVELFFFVYNHKFSEGILEGLRHNGVIPQSSAVSTALSTYHRASLLERQGKFVEAQRAFEQVLESGEGEYLSGAHFHLGQIHAQLRNENDAKHHFRECLRFNPGHRKAREALQVQSAYNEVRPNVFERVDMPATPRVLFVLFGPLSDIVNGFPVVTALRETFGAAEIAWLTLPQYEDLVRASAADRVIKADLRGVIDWQWVEAEGFSHVYCPDVQMNSEEWITSGLHVTDFMASKCGVAIETRRAQLEPGPEAIFEAEAILRENGLQRGRYVTIAHTSVGSRVWPHSHVAALIEKLACPVVLFGVPRDPRIPGALAVFGQPLRTVAALIRWSTFFVGSESGVSWIATTTDVPIALFLDPSRPPHAKVSFREELKGAKNNITEWDLGVGPERVLQHMESVLGTEIMHGHWIGLSEGQVPTDGASTGQPQL